MTTPSPFDLTRFITAQETCYARVLDELKSGRKTTHWMWFIFPQIAGLGHSAMAQRYAIASLAEARAYLAHPLLGARLHECTALVNAISGASASDIFGDPDDMKFRSAMTLFAAADEDEPLFRAALAKYFADEVDSRTLDILAGSAR